MFDLRYRNDLNLVWFEIIFKNKKSILYTCPNKIIIYVATVLLQQKKALAYPIGYIF